MTRCFNLSAAAPPPTRSFFSAPPPPPPPVRPDLLIMFGTLPSGVPAVRKLIDYLREVNSCPEMQIMCCGGIYKRAEGLAEEIGADLFAPDAEEAVQVANAHPDRKATVDQQTVGRTRRIRKAAARKERQQAT